MNQYPSLKVEVVSKSRPTFVSNLFTDMGLDMQTAFNCIYFQNRQNLTIILLQNFDTEVWREPCRKKGHCNGDYISYCDFSHPYNLIPYFLL
jgi:hypothetical protein